MTYSLVLPLGLGYSSEEPVSTVLPRDPRLFVSTYAHVQLIIEISRGLQDGGV